ncbi:MAG: Smr/MutS family protein [Candidatus Methanoperedens sp.]|nr:Smr/MutS family protein [Candidatus Methanoperedens sp.]
MAWFEVDIFNRCVEVDLHDYSRMTAIQVTRDKIKEAYEHGFRYVRLIHGASNIRHKEDGGSIKFALRSMLNNGGLNNWVEEKGSKNHRLKDESMILALRKNPKPMDGEWKEMPMGEY